MNTLFRKFILNSTGFMLAFLFLSSTIYAGKWTGDVDTDWNNAANWFQNNIHVNGENLTFANNPPNFPIISSGTIIIADLRLGGNTITQTGGTIEVDYYNTTTDAIYNQTYGLLVIHRTFINTGTFYSTGGTIQFSDVTGATHTYNGSTQFNNVIIDSGTDPTFDEDLNIINISGDFTNNNTTLDNSQGTVIFNGTGTQSIYSASTNNTFYNLEIDQTGGDISFTSDVTILNNFANTSGSPIEENGNDVSAGSGDPLPVELTSFSVSINNDLAQLNWETATEVNNYGFEVERTSENNDWSKLGFVEGHGNSNSPKYYSFIDNSLNESGKYSYRLKQIDIDGTYVYTDVVNIDLSAPAEFKLNQNYPNPFNPTTSINYSVSKDTYVELIVYDILGNEVAVLENGYQAAGLYNRSFDASNLSSGFYFYTIKAGNYSSTMKMLLMK